MPRKLISFVFSVLALGFASATADADPRKVELNAIQHLDAELVVVQPNGTEKSYTPADLEELPTHSLTTQTPWRETPARFEGVLLDDLLAANNLSDADAILVTAENEFTSTFARAVWEGADILVATRVNGTPISRRERGPFLFVVDHDSYIASGLVEERHLVWMAARIEAIE